MPDYVIACGACQTEFAITTERDRDNPRATTMPDSRRCPSCGTRHAPDGSWNSPVVVSSPLELVTEPRVVMAPAKTGGTAI